MQGILVQTPEMPIPYKTELLSLSRELEGFGLTSETIPVVHTCATGFLLRRLSEHNEVRVGKVMIVAPWIDPYPTGDTC